MDFWLVPLRFQSMTRLLVKRVVKERPQMSSAVGDQ